MNVWVRVMYGKSAPQALWGGSGVGACAVRPVQRLEMSEVRSCVRPMQQPVQQPVQGVVRGALVCCSGAFARGPVWDRLGLYSPKRVQI